MGSQPPREASMTNSAPTVTPPLPPVEHLAEAVASANSVLYYAIGKGLEIPSTLRGPIVKARTALARGELLETEEEGMFLDAYSRLVRGVGTVTGAQPAAPSRARTRAGGVSRPIGLQPPSRA